MGYYLDRLEQARFLRADESTDITVCVGLRNGHRLPIIRKGDVILLRPNRGEEQMDLLALIRYPINGSEFCAMAIEFLNRDHLIDGRARHDSLHGVRMINFYADRVFSGPDAISALSKDLITNPYAFAFQGRPKNS